MRGRGGLGGGIPIGVGGGGAGLLLLLLVVLLTGGLPGGGTDGGPLRPGRMLPVRPGAGGMIRDVREMLDHGDGLVHLCQDDAEVLSCEGLAFTIGDKVG